MPLFAVKEMEKKRNSGKNKKENNKLPQQREEVCLMFGWTLNPSST